MAIKKTSDCINPMTSGRIPSETPWGQEKPRKLSQSFKGTVLNIKTTTKKAHK